MAESPVVYTFTPAKPGDFLQGVPQRDLTEEDVANLDPLNLFNATVAGPSGTPMYTAVKAPKDQKTAKDTKEGDAK